MLIKATQKYTRQTPRKVRLIANTVKKLPIEQAIGQLAVIERKATLVVTKVLQQAIANATHNHGYQLSDLSIDSILVTEGPRYRRFQAVSRGRAHGIAKRTSHITVILKTKEEKKSEPVKSEAKAAAPKVVETKPKAAPKKVVKKVTKK